MRVLLVQMPFFTLDTPSISLSLVKASLEREGIDCDLDYFNLDFGDRLGIDLYSWIAGSSPPYLLFGDLLFTPVLREREVPVERLRELIRPLGTPGVPPVPEEMVDAFPDLVEAARRFVQEKLRSVPWSSYDLAGFATMFQIAPALAMSRLVKGLPDAPRVILGGSYCEGDMGEYLHRCFPWIDYVCRGEGETLVVELARHLAGTGLPKGRIRGLVWRDEDGGTRCNESTATLAPSDGPPAETDPEHPLDALPVPAYDDWLKQIRDLDLLPPEKLRMPIETSRGCWWGQKHHCTFCGLNGGTITYRRKSPGRALAEFRGLMRYGIGMVHSVDDILDVRYFKTLLPELAKLDHGFEIFYEIKANLTREQVQQLHGAGIVWIQPGIESLSTPLLKLMDKGITAVQNVRLLRDAAEAGLGVAWNMLYGFPGEDPQVFAEVASFLPSLFHLQPPYITCCQVRMHRFSPLFNGRHGNGLKDVHPADPYYEFFPFDRETVSRLAYYFGHAYVSHPDPNSYIGPVADQVRTWHAEVGSAAFLSVRGEDALHLLDTRGIATTPHAVLRGLARDLYEAASCAAGLEALAGDVGRPEADIRPILDGFVARRWMLLLDDKYLPLAVPADRYVPPHVPLSIVERSVIDRHCEKMARTRQGFVPHVPSFERLRRSLAPAEAVPV